MGIASGMRSAIRRHPGLTAAAVLVLAGGTGFALYWFAPWNLFVDKRVDEALPGATASLAAEPEAATGADPDTGPGDEPAAAEVSPAQAGSTTLASGPFSGLEHATTGTALVVELSDGRRFLRLEDLETSNGPDLRVILSDQPPSDDWHVWDDGRYLDLGALKGNLGSSNYEIPAGVDLAGLQTAVIWCRRFSVGFGVAPLQAMG
jgi:Electron transfer DM13